MAIGLEVSDDGLDGGAAPEFLFDLAMDAAPLAGTVDPERIGRLVALIALVDVDAADLGPGQGLGFLQHVGQGVAVIGLAGQGLGMDHELAAG